MINFYEIICSIDEFLNSKQKGTVASEFIISRYGMKISIHQVYSNQIDENYFKICELVYLQGQWKLNWEKPNSKNGDYIEYIVSIMNGEVKDSFEYDIENYNWQP